MKVLVADKFDEQGMQKLRDEGLEVIFEPKLTAEELPARIRDVDPTFLVVRSTKVQADAIDAASKLAMIVRAGAGYDTIDTAYAAEKGIHVCNCPGTNSAAVAELTIGLLVAIDRRIPDQVADVKQGVWNKQGYSKARGLKGQTLGIVGMGQIGQLVMKRALAFEMNIVFFDVVCRKDLCCDGVRQVTMDELYAQADIISLHAPNSEATKGMINASSIAKMKDGVWLINTSRGGLVVEDDLYDALKSKKVGFAALDVYPNEPAATDTAIQTKFAQLDNFYGTHHVGASTAQAQAAVGEKAVCNILCYAKDKKVCNCVNAK